MCRIMKFCVQTCIFAAKARIINYQNDERGLLMLRELPVSLLARIGRCGEAALILLLRLVLYAIGAVFRLLRELFRLLAALLRLGFEQLRRFAAGEAETARAIRKISRSAQESKGRAALGMLGTLLFSRHGIFRMLLRYLIPATCCLILFSAVRRGTSQSYAVAVAVDGKPIGSVASEADYMAAEEIVRKRLSYAAEETHISLNRTLQLEKAEGPVLTAGDLADKLLQNAEIDLFEGWGVYVNDEFVGAVDDKHPIEAALVRELSMYSDRMHGELDEIYFADTVSYEWGNYLTASRVPAQKLANKLVSAEDTTRTYTAGKRETVYSVAERFSTTADEIRRLNPDVPDVVPYAARMTVPVEKRFLPIVYTKTIKATDFLDYESRTYETPELPQGTEAVLVRGVQGEKEQKVQVTFTDGAETSRKVLSSRLVVRPVDEEIGIGTYTAQPWSYDTKIDGSGRYPWPVDGGKITSLFGGERDHGGLDIGAAEYSEIYAADSGTVMLATWEESYGNFVLIDHGDGYETLYAHCVELLTQPGKKVKRGEPIALVGNTGDSTGPHLHFEVRYNGVRQNPALYMRVNMDN